MDRTGELAAEIGPLGLLKKITSSASRPPTWTPGR
jgi:hypothetical protein